MNSSVHALQMFCSCKRAPLPCISVHRQCTNAPEVEGHVERAAARSLTSNAPRETKCKPVLLRERDGDAPGRARLADPCGAATRRRAQAGG